MFFLTNIILYVVALQLVHAIPLVKRIVIDPHITSPSAGTVWTPGNTEVVTWYVDFCGCLCTYSLLT